MNNNPYHRPLLRDLPAANSPPTCVTRDTDLKEAVTIMMVNDYSQLPVMQGDRNVKGYVSWRSIGEVIALNKECKIVRDCMKKALTILDDSEPLLKAVIIIAKEDFILVRNGENQIIVGLVTTSDITSSFHELAEPFFLIGQIENSIRQIIDMNYNQEEIRAAKDPTDERRNVNSASDLTFGEYIRLFENESNWTRFSAWQISRPRLIEYLLKVKDIRNDIMHFRPSGVPPEKILVLRNMAQFLEQLHP